MVEESFVVVEEMKKMVVEVDCVSVELIMNIEVLVKINIDLVFC